FAVQFRSTANWTSMRKRIPNIRSRSESALQPASLWNNITISLDAPFNLPPASAVTRSPNKFSCRTRSPSCVSGKDFHSRTSANRRSNASVHQSAPMPLRGDNDLDEKMFVLYYELSSNHS